MGVLVFEARHCRRSEREEGRQEAGQDWKKADNPQALIDAAIESLPYRNEDDIRALFTRLRFLIKQAVRLRQLFCRPDG